MSREYYFTLLSKSIGDTVRLETSDGYIYQGFVVQIDSNYLYLFAIDDSVDQRSVSQITDEDLDVIPLASIVEFNFISLYW